MDLRGHQAACRTSAPRPFLEHDNCDVDTEPRAVMLDTYLAASRRSILSTFQSKAQPCPRTEFGTKIVLRLERPGFPRTPPLYPMIVLKEKSSLAGLSSGGEVGASPNRASWESVLRSRSVTRSPGTIALRLAPSSSVRCEAPGMFLGSIFSRSLRTREGSTLIPAFGLIAISV